MKNFFKSLLLLVLLATVQNGFSQSDFFQEFDSIREASEPVSTVSDSTDDFLSSYFNLKPSAMDEYYEFSINHRKRAFNFQYYSSIFIFITVLLIVYSGLVLSYLNFRQNLKTNTTQESEFEIGKSGIKIRSSVIGLIILTISITFLYLYLRYVYIISEIGAPI